MKKALIFVIAAMAALPHVGCGGGGSAPLTQTAVTAPAPSQTPAITSISPSSAAAGGAAFTLTVTGANFVAASIVNFGGAPQTTTFVSATELTAAIPAAAVVSIGTLSVSVTTPPPGEGTSNAMSFVVGKFIGTTPRDWMTVAIAPDPSGKFGKFAYVTRADSNSVSMYSINASTGGLQPIGTVAAGTIPMSIVVDPKGKFAYVANEDSNDISMYAINQITGALQPLGSVTAGTGPISLTVDPFSKFVYVVNEASYDISMYAVDATTGVLNPLGRVAAGTLPTSITIDPSGKFAYVTNADPDFPLELNGRNGNMSMYAIDLSSDLLNSLGNIATEVYPRSVAVDPSGKFVYVANCGDFERNQGDVGLYAVNGTAGTLTSIGTTGAGSCPLALGVHPSGKFAYALNTGSDGGPDIEGVSMYAIDAAAGTLTSLGLVDNTGYCPSSLAVDPSGQFAYVTNHCDQTISMYTIDLTTGILTLIGTIS